MPRLIVLLLFMTLATPTFAETRLALVIGNSHYGSVGTLPNPEGDALLVGDTLRSEGFQVTAVKDATRSELLRALNLFADQASNADWALVYYAGHGMEIGGTNYLIPVDAELKYDRDAQDEAVSLSRVLDSVSGARKLRLVILDACRNNPFAATMKRTVAFRSAVDRGLARPEPQAGVLVVYSAAAGEVAADGTSDHSPFTSALVTRLKEPGLEVRRFFDVVTADVLDATSQRQRPFQYGSNPSREEFFFKPPTPPPSPGPSPDERTWSYLKASTDLGVMKTFRDALAPDSPLIGTVKARISELEAAAEPPRPAAAPAPPVAPQPSVVPPSPVSGVTADERTWSTLKASTDLGVMKTFRDALAPDSPLVGSVKARIAELETVAEPPPRPAAAPPAVPQPSATPTPTASDPTPDERTWSTLKASTDLGAIKRFRDTLAPDSSLAGPVKARIAELESAEEAPRPEVVPAPSVTPAPSQKRPDAVSSPAKPPRKSKSVPPQARTVQKTERAPVRAVPRQAAKPRVVGNCFTFAGQRSCE